MKSVIDEFNQRQPHAFEDEGEIGAGAPELPMFLRHDLMVRSLRKNGEEIMNKMDPVRADLLHMAVGIAGEAGELLDAIKKHVFYGQDLDVENVIEELGDLDFYETGVRQILDLTEDEILAYNYEKLGKRYENHVYSDQAAKDRADKDD